LTPAKHVVPKQQPFAHEVVVQVQAPPTHCWPAAHSGPEPQVHEPLPHPSASVGSHEVHAAPPLPQFVTEGVSHVLPLQQPDAQVTEHPAHALPMHAPPEPQLVHAAPPEPHALPWDPVWQTPLPSQHP
jgi:hypothetical protein